MEYYATIREDEILQFPIAGGGYGIGTLYNTTVNQYLSKMKRKKFLGYCKALRKNG